MPSFDVFTNPFQDPQNVPEQYRRHPSLQQLFKADGSYQRPAEDPVTMWAIDILHQEHNVPLEAMALEVGARFSRSYGGFADVVIFDDRYKDAVGDMNVAFIMVEAMEPGKKFGGTEPEGWKEHYEWLNAYISQSPPRPDTPSSPAASTLLSTAVIWNIRAAWKKFPAYPPTKAPPKPPSTAPLRWC